MNKQILKCVPMWATKKKSTYESILENAKRERVKEKRKRAVYYNFP